MQNTNSKSEHSLIMRILFSKTLLSKNRSQKIAYVSIATAFVVIANMFFEFKFADVQFSLTIAISALVGVVLGGALGFVACFLGDLVGFLYNSGGFAYLPWIGISMGLTALIAGAIIGAIKSDKKWFLYLKIAIVCILTLLICTIGINTTAFWILYSKSSYGTYLVARLFVQGQIWNSLFNYALLFAAVPALKKIKALKIYID